MGCPQCQWNTLTFVLETRQWICKRCRHEWKETRTIKNRPKKKAGGTKKRRPSSRK